MMMIISTTASASAAAAVHAKARGRVPRRPQLKLLLLARRLRHRRVALQRGRPRGSERRRRQVARTRRGGRLLRGLRH